MKKQFKSVGKTYPRMDGFDKVTGKAQYFADIAASMDNLLHGKILRSPLAHAKIKSIDVSRAQALPGVACVLTYKDAPQIPYTSCGHPLPFDTPKDRLILTGHPRYVGDPIAAVAAETVDIATEALSLIDVEYEELPFYTDSLEAMKEGAYEIHEGSKNICGENEYEIGDVKAAFAQAAHIVEDEFHTPIIAHCPIETHGSIVKMDHRGRLTVYSPNQSLNILRERLATCLGKSIRDIRVIKTTLGGGFGGKQEPVYEPVNCLLTMATKRPVALELTREECIATTTTRHSGIFRLRTALDESGKMLGREMTVIQNTGAYSSHGHNVIFNIATQFGMMYPTPNLHFKGVSVYTNILVAAAMRAYGIPQYTFSMESHVDHIAKVLHMDPLEYRLKYACKPGDPINMENMHIYTNGLRDCAARGREVIGYDAFRKLPKQTGDIRRGIGVAFASYGQSCWPHGTENSGARVVVAEDSSQVTLFINSTEIGQGTDNTMAQICAEALGVPFDRVEVIEGDTDLCPFDPGAFASRQTYVTGMAVKKAAEGCKKTILERAAQLLKRDAKTLDLYDCHVVDADTLENLMPMKDVTLDIYYNLHDKLHIVESSASHMPDDNMLTFLATFAEVEVDTKTGKVDVKKLVTTCDAGTIVNPQGAMGQLMGGSTMCYGYGMTEQILIDPATGRVRNDNMLDYKVPTFADFPDIDAAFVETYEPSSAYGNKSLGEPPNISPAPAIRNAVYDAIGIGINENPLTPERVFLAIANAEKEGK